MIWDAFNTPYCSMTAIDSLIVAAVPIALMVIWYIIYG